MTESQHGSTRDTRRAMTVEPSPPFKDQAAADLPDGSWRKGSRWQTIAIVASLILIVAILAAAGYGLISHPPFAAVLRDIAIIVLSLATLLTCIFLAILLFQLQSLIALLRDELRPTLRSINETAGTVRGTTTFVTDAVVTPVITVASYASALRAVARSLFRGSSQRPNEPHGPKPRQ